MLRKDINKRKRFCANSHNITKFVAVKRIFILFSLYVLVCGVSHAQVNTLDDLVENMQDEDKALGVAWEAELEEMAYLQAHPIDINKATSEDLSAIPILNERQIEDIITYVFLHGGMRSISELMAIESLDYDTRQSLSLFCYAGQEVFQRKDTVNVKNLFRKSHQELLTRFDVPLYYREGYMHSPSNGGYCGNALANRVLWRLRSMNNLEMGLTGKKDQGEPFRGACGYDSYGGYLFLKNLGAVRAVVVGDYKLGFGEGLIVNNGYSLGKSALQGSTRGVRANTATDEYNYFRGAALSLRFSGVELTTWVSMRRLDATLNSAGEAQTLITSGYHRTKTELGKKGNLGSLVAGADVSWSSRWGLKFGMTGYFQKFSLSLNPGDQQYRKYYPRGKRFGVLGLHYGYAGSWLVFSGETAYSTELGGVATLNKLTWKVSGNCRLTALQRYYQKKYYSFYASAVGENSRIQNETGEMLRLEAQPMRNWTLTAYADFFYNPWLRYGLTHSSWGQDALLLNEWTFSDGHQLSVRYQIKRKESSDQMQVHHRIRLKYTANVSERLRLQTFLNVHLLGGKGGVAVSQSVRYRPASKVFSLYGLLSGFSTSGWDTRVVVSEPALQSSYSSTSLYGKGMRGAVAASYAFWHQRLVAEAKYSFTCYFDRTGQGSGMQRIFSRWKNDLSLQIRVKI